MKLAAPGLVSDLRNETSVFRLVAIAAIGGLFFYTSLQVQPLLVGMALMLYVFLSLALICLYLLPLRAPPGSETTKRVAFFILLEAIITINIAILLKGDAMFYFYLTAFNGYAGLRSASKGWRLPLLFLTSFLSLAFLLQTKLDWKVVTWNSLPLFFLLAFAAEFVNRQWEHRTQLNQLLSELSQAHQQLQDYIDQAESLAILQERGRLAHEIHDTLGHSLTALDVQLELLARLPLSQIKERQQAAELARQLAKDSLAGLRRAVKALQPSELETLSLPEAVEQLVQTFEQQQPIPISYMVTGIIRPLPPRYSLLLFRATQEALTNIQRHAAKTTGIQLELTFAAFVVRLTVENTAPASPRQTETSQGGYGLRGLAERTADFGGQFNTEVTESGGFRMEISLPISPID